MRNISIALASLLLASTSANAATIIDLCNTGQKQQCNGLKNGNGAELNWKLGGQPNAFTPNSINAAWLANGPDSRWITPSNNGNQSYDPVTAGTYVYSLLFNIGSAFNPGTAQFAGRFAVDNLVDSIRLNGTTIAGSGGTFNQWTAFSAASGFVAGNNLLEFNVRNTAQRTGNPTGLRVEFLSSSIAAAVPEPATWGMMILGFGVVGGAVRRRKAAVTARIAYS